MPPGENEWCGRGASAGRDPMVDGTSWRDWDDLDADEQLALREAYGRHLEDLPPTCDLEEKLDRFRRWLAGYQIRYAPDQKSR